MKFESKPQSIIWFRDHYLAGQLELKPPFQRKPVWAAKQKAFLIESILLELPVPEVYLQHELRIVDGEEKSMFYVVDGQQRIRTILQFIGADKTESEAEWNKFVLDKLDVDSQFKDVSYSDLDDTTRGAFLKYNLAIRMLDESNDTAVRNVFKRLNKYLTKLSEQELRNATYTGPFMQLALKLANDKFWAENDLVTPALIRRMKDIEFVSELLIGVLHGPQGGSPRLIDQYYGQYEDYDDEEGFPGQAAAEKRFGRTLQLLKDVLPGEEESRFRHNRTDFYSVFAATAALLRTHEFPKANVVAARKALRAFERKVDDRLVDENREVPKAVVNYVRAVEKGANEKKRRADRHTELLALLTPFFKKIPKNPA